MRRRAGFGRENRTFHRKLRGVCGRVGLLTAQRDPPGAPGDRKPWPRTQVFEKGERGSGRVGVRQD